MKPPRLRRGSTLGVVATSLPITRVDEAVRTRAFRRLRARGFRLVLAPGCERLQGHSAGSARERADDLQRFVADPNVDGLLAFWGGYQTHQVLEHLDYDLFRAHPKALIGYSDLTALQAGLLACAGLVTFSAPAAITFAKPTQFDYTWRAFERVVMLGQAPLALHPSKRFSDTLWWRRHDRRMQVEPSPPWRALRPGRAEGRLVGGNLGTLLLLHGTPYWPDLRGAVLFVEEDEEESVYTVDRLFTRLRHLGIFGQIRALIVGRFPRSVGFAAEDSLAMLLEQALEGYELPVLYDVDFGHTDPLLTLPLGVRCRVETTPPRLTLLEPAVR